MLQRLGALDRHRGRGRGELTTPRASKKCREIILRAQLKFTLETKVSLQQNTQLASTGQEGEREENKRREEAAGRGRRGRQDGGERDMASPATLPGTTSRTVSLDLRGS